MVETEISIGADALADITELVSGYSKIAVITDEGASRACADKLGKHLEDVSETIVLPSGEDNKNLKVAEGVLRQLREAGFDRNSLIIGLGGGVINDLAGFCASIYMRGIDWIMAATTLTAQADASIGGKTGVNLDKYKNMAGSFWPAKAVLIDPSFLDTLSADHLRNGLAEIIKMGFIADVQILEHVAKIDDESILGEELDRAAELAAKAKIEIVSRDTFESGERKLLNFGHTVGHAVEAISLEDSRPLSHGEAISIGMIAEARLSESENVCRQGLADELSGVLKRFGLPTSFQASAGEVLKRITSDKKNVGGSIRWTLPKEAGQGIFDHVADPAHIESAIGSVLD